MGLYLAIFDNDTEIEGVEIGLYSDFSYFRNIVVNELENGQAGLKYPTLNLHSDCDGSPVGLIELCEIGQLVSSPLSLLSSRPCIFTASPPSQRQNYHFVRSF